MTKNRTFTFTVSCPDGKEYHEQLKAEFPNLSEKIMLYLKMEMNLISEERKAKVEREMWVMHIPYPALKRLIGKVDPWKYSRGELISMLKSEDIIVTDNEAERLHNILRDEEYRKNEGRFT